MAKPSKPVRRQGMELFEITPVMLGGHPTDPKNKTWLTRQQHFEAVCYWNRVIAELRRREKTEATDRAHNS